MGRPIGRRVSVAAACLLAAALAGCGGSAAKPALTETDVQSAFQAQGIALTTFSSGQLVSSSPPTVEVEIFGSAQKAAATSAPQEVNGVEVKPVGTRNVLVWVDAHAPADFQQHVSAALAALQHD
jgi:hypothetical protein